MTIDPFEPLKVLGIALCALVLGALVGGVPAYFIGKANEAEKRGEAIGSLKTSVDSCNVAAGEAKKAAESAKAASDDLNTRVGNAIAAGMNEAARIGRQRSNVLATAPRGATECERTSNMIADHFRKGAP